MAVIVMDFFRAVLQSLCPKINRKSYIRVAPWKRNVFKTLITKKPKDSHSRHVMEVREAIQKADSTIPSTQSPSQHFIRISSKKSCLVGGLCGEYASVVTEYSDPKVQEVAQVEENLELPDLQIKGTQLKLNSFTKKERESPASGSQASLASAPGHANKLTTTPEHPASSSMSFEVQMANSKTKKPGRKTKRKRKTREELETKQATAAQRRMELEQKLLERLELRRKKESEVKESLYKQLVTVPTRALPPIKYPPKITHDEIPVVFGVN